MLSDYAVSQSYQTDAYHRCATGEWHYEFSFLSVCSFYIIVRLDLTSPRDGRGFNSETEGRSAEDHSVTEHELHRLYTSRFVTITTTSVLEISLLFSEVGDIPQHLVNLTLPSDKPHLEQILPQSSVPNCDLCSCTNFFLKYFIFIICNLLYLNSPAATRTTTSPLRPSSPYS
jgi:hypothetical protein